jgi:4-alpha-glucanotransferase
LAKKEIDRISSYVGLKATKNNIHQIMHRLALMSVSDLAIVPMQDIVGLDEKAIMNRPGTDKGNWTWRLAPDQLPMKRRRELKKMNQLFGRWKEPEKEAE